MRSLQDAVYNWLTIQVVADYRPDDASANETADFFYEMLQSDHQVKEIEVNCENELYQVTCHTSEEVRKLRFPAELIDLMLVQIKDEPHKFKNYS